MDQSMLLFIAVILSLFIGASLVFIFSRLGRRSQDVQTEMLKELKRDINENLKSNRETLDSSSRMMHERVRDFTESITKMHSALGKVYDSVQSSTEKMSSFQNIFRTPKLRGQWGEANLEYLLTQVYPNERILRQHAFQGGAVVDFVIKLPNDLLLPIDAKFPLETYVAYAEEEDEQIRRQKMQLFVRSVKDEIDSIASKYIRPEEGTVDRALLFIPAESVYYDIMFSLKDVGISEHAHKKHIVLVSPNTLNLTLSVFEHWFKDIELSQRTGEIMRRLGGVVVDSKKLHESFTKIGKHIDNTKSAYDSSTKRLELLTNRVKKVLYLGDKKIAESDAVDELTEPEDLSR